MKINSLGVLETQANFRISTNRVVGVEQLKSNCWSHKVLIEFLFTRTEVRKIVMNTQTGDKLINVKWMVKSGLAAAA
jgi:hypothetical protein